MTEPRADEAPRREGPAWTAALILLPLLLGALTDKILALRGGQAWVGLWGQLQSVSAFVSGVALSGIGQGLTVWAASTVPARAGVPAAALSLAALVCGVASVVAAIGVMLRPDWLPMPAPDPVPGLIAVAAGLASVAPGLLGAVWIGQRRRARAVWLGIGMAAPTLAALAWAGPDALTVGLAAGAGVQALLSAALIRDARRHAGAWGGTVLAALRPYLPIGIAIGVMSPASSFAIRAIVGDAIGVEDLGRLQAVWRSTDGITGIAATACSVWLLPRLASQVRAPGFLRALGADGVRIVVPAIAALALAWWGREPLFRLLYTGAFAVDAQTYALFVLADALRVCAWIFLFGLYAQGRTWTVVVTEVASLPLHAGLVWVCSDGLTLSRIGALQALTYAVYLACLAESVRRGLTGPRMPAR